jgi:hypothetical protein
VAISEALSTEDPLAPPNSSLNPESAGRARDLPNRWVRLAAALLRAAREADNSADFDRWATVLAQYQRDYAWLVPRLAYERCLLALARLDHAAVERALDDLDAGAEDVFWKVRKAGILAELGKTKEAFRLVGEALSEIRLQMSHGAPDIPTLSREGWAMVLAEGFRFYAHLRELRVEVESEAIVPRGLEPHRRTARRWEVLRQHGCDALDDFFAMRRTVDYEPPGMQPQADERAGFELWQRTRIEWMGRGSSSGGSWEHLPGLQAKRLVEETGLPPVAGDLDLARGLLLRAAVWLEERAPDLALGIILRVSTDEDNGIFDNFFNRSRIALLEDSQVDVLVERIESALDYAVPRAAAARTEEDQERAN